MKKDNLGRELTLLLLGMGMVVGGLFLLFNKLHVEFHLPLPLSRTTVSDAGYGLSP